MAYETGTATDIENLKSKLFTFLTGLTPAWVSDEEEVTEPGQATIHKDNLYVTFAWDDAPDKTDLAIYQSTGWTTSTDPWNMPGDSGNGDTSPNPVNDGRRVNFESTGPFTAYHFFASEAAPFYCHVVVEVDAGRFRHFGMGHINKIGDWTGGEYAYGHYWDQVVAAIDNPSTGNHHVLLDGVSTTANRGATMRIEGLTGMAAAVDWGVFVNNTVLGTDRAGNARVQLSGTTRGGGLVSLLGWMPTSQLTAWKPLLPIDAYWVDEGESPDKVVYLGDMPDIAMINMKNLTPGEEITVGSDTWKCFPIVRKQFTQGDVEESWSGGIAYKKFS